MYETGGAVDNFLIHKHEQLAYTRPIQPDYSRCETVKMYTTNEGFVILDCNHHSTACVDNIVMTMEIGDVFKT